MEGMVMWSLDFRIGSGFIARQGFFSCMISDNLFNFSEPQIPSVHWLISICLIILLALILFWTLSLPFIPYPTIHFSPFLPPNFIQYNWKIKLYIFKVYNVMIWYTNTSWNDYHSWVIWGLCTIEYYCEDKNEIMPIMSLAEHEANSQHSINRSYNNYYYFLGNPVSCYMWSVTQWMSLREAGYLSKQA